MPKEIGLFYGSSTCYTEFVSEKIVEIVGNNRIDMHDIATSPITLMESYNSLILGIPTWDYGELQEDWDAVWDDICNLNLNEATCAIFGLGDQKGYTDWFQDAIGYLYHQLLPTGVTIVGEWPNVGYKFDSSKGLTTDQTFFRGLALDEENQPELTQARLGDWLDQVLKQFS